MVLTQSLRRRRGLTLIEIMIASAILSVVFLATLSLLRVHRLQSRKAMEQAIMLDFTEHYLELARCQPYTDIVAGRPINALYDGDHGAPNVRFPAGNDWISLWTTDYRGFHPDLEWFAGREPQLRCRITSQMVGAASRSRRIALELRWRPPMRVGAAWMTIALDSVVYPEFY